jgi:tellurite resistance protein TerC
MDRVGATSAPHGRRFRTVNPGPLGWVLFNALVLCLLALDLGVFHRRAHEVRVREAAIWSAVWIALALLFGAYVYLQAGHEVALEYLTGYVVEKVLSIDNIFVMVMIFGFFGVAGRYQHRVLFWGVLGALVMRGAFIALGSYALHRWHGVLYVFGALLLLTGLRMAFRKHETPDLEKNLVVRTARRVLPVSGHYHEHHFFTRENGRLLATPLLLVLITIEVFDLVFAIDSIPAVFAITQDPFVVFTSNVFAVLGLRSLYFVLADGVRRFVYLRFGLAAVLVFVGAKMLAGGIVRVPTPLSLLIIAAAVGLAIAASLVFPPPASPTGDSAEAPRELALREPEDAAAR